ncbi:MAG: aminopeptidase P family N-terminal domain-containing protein, partial [Gemmatimonadales bacterium]
MPPDRRPERQAALRVALGVEGLDGLVITHLPNIRYLTGF